MTRIAYQALRQTSSPETEPLSVAECRDHIRGLEGLGGIELTLEGLIAAARESAQDILHRALTTETWTLYLECFPSCGVILLPQPPLRSVTSITYTREDGSTAVVSASDYVVDTFSEPGRILLKSGSSWPSDTLQVGPSVAVVFQAGYGDTAEDVPRTFRLAMLQFVATWYETPEAVQDARRMGQVLPMPMAGELLLWPRRFFM